jgi:putative membrane protein
LHGSNEEVRMTTKTKLAIALFVAPCAFAACATHQANVEAQTPAAQPAAKQPAEQPPSAQRRPAAASRVVIAIETLPKPDRDFLSQAAGANLVAIKLGELAANNGASVEVRSLGREMVDTHLDLSEQLRVSAHTEGIALPVARMTPRQQRMYDELAALSGEAFDEAFEREVVKLQEETIASFQNEAVHGRLSELAMLANQALPLLNQRARTVRNQLHRM